MTSPLVIRAFESYANNYQSFKTQTIPVMWVKGRKKVAYISEARDLLFFYFSLMISCLYAAFSLFIITKTIFEKDQSTPLYKVIIIIMITILTLFEITLFIVLILIGDVCVTGANALFKLEVLFRQGLISNYFLTFFF